MSVIGVSRPYAAHYMHNGVGGITYNDGMYLARAASNNVDVTTSESDILYGDNGMAESSGGEMTSATLSVSTTELPQEASKFILGIKQEIMMVDGSPVTVNIRDDDMRPKDCGYGVIEMHQILGVIRWRAIILPRISFKLPNDAATTKAGNIEWQNPTITADIFRAETEKHPWYLDAWFDSESKADAFIRQYLNIKDGTLDALTITSTAGSKPGATIIQVEPELPAGRAYRYITGENVTLPAYGEILNGWDSWNGVDELSVLQGDKIVVAQTDSLDKAMGAGIASVVITEA